MRNKEFYQAIGEYRSAFKGDAKKELACVDLSGSDCVKRKFASYKRQRNVIIAACLAVCLVLAVALPIGVGVARKNQLNNDYGIVSGDRVYYRDSGIFYRFITNKDDVRNVYNFNYRLLDDDYGDGLFIVLYGNKKIPVGIRQAVIYGEGNIHSLSMYVTDERNSFTPVDLYDCFIDKAVYNGTEFTYIVWLRSGDTVHYKIKYVENGIKYCVHSAGSADHTPVDVLEKVFG